MFYLSALLLYFPRVLPGIETQPCLTVLMASIGLLLPKGRNERGGYVLVVALILVLLVVKGVISSDYLGSTSSLELLVGPMFLFGASARADGPPSRRAMAGVTCATALLVLLELLTPDVYRMIASALLQRFTVAGGQHGISLLTPEPTYAAISLIYLLILSRWAACGGKWSWIEWTLVVCLGLTFSTYAVLLLGLFLLIERPLMLVGLCGGAVSAIVLLVVKSGANIIDSVRAFVALTNLMTANWSDFLPSISTLDPSLGSRMITNAAAIQTPGFAPLGLNLGCSAVAESYKAVGYQFVYNNPVLTQVMASGCLKPQAYLPSLLLAFGWVSLFVMFICFSVWERCIDPDHRSITWIAPLAIAAVMLSVQCQVTNPIPWLLIYIAFRGQAPATLRSQVQS